MKKQQQRQEMINLMFRISVSPFLVKEERNPFATAYITDDILHHPYLVQTESFGERIWKNFRERNLNKPNAKKKTKSKGSFKPTTTTTPGTSEDDVDVDVDEEEEGDGKQYEVRFTFESTFSIPIGEIEKITDDTAICIQCFCELDNHKFEPCSHRCGFAAFALKGMATNILSTSTKSTRPIKYWAKMLGHGRASDKRGMVEIELLGKTHETLVDIFSSANISVSSSHLLLIGEPTNETIIEMYETANEYFLAINDILETMTPISERIRIAKLPMYVLSSGTMLPSCAFVLYKNIPHTPEEFYINCITICIDRAMPQVRDEKRRLKAFCAETLTPTTAKIFKSSTSPLTTKEANETERIQSTDDFLCWDEKASVLMDAATLLAASLPYLYDYSLSDDGTKLVMADEFTRTIMLTLALDCEDGSNAATIFLRDVLTAESANGKWTSELMVAASTVRAQYITTISLKAVTRAAESEHKREAQPSLIPKFFAAHACCDMIPIVSLSEMIKRSGWRTLDADAIDAIINERKSSLIPGNKNLRIVVGESTGFVSSYVPNHMVLQSWGKESARSILSGLFKSARFVAKEDLMSGSSFYAYTVSALVVDTSFSKAALAVANKRNVAWLVPQIVYAITSNKQTTVKTGITQKCFKYGVDHRDYVKNTDDICALCVKPVSKQMMDIMVHLSKYEHPIPPIELPGADSSVLFPTYKNVLKELSRLDCLQTTTTAAGAQPKAKYCGKMAKAEETPGTEVTICINARDLSEEPVKVFVEAALKNEKLLRLNYSLKFITKTVGILVLVMRFSL
jgi:hypothetical protein